MMTLTDWLLDPSYNEPTKERLASGLEGLLYQWLAETHAAQQEYLKRHPDQKSVASIKPHRLRTQAVGERVYCLMLMICEAGQPDPVQCMICIGRESYVRAKYEDINDQLTQAALAGGPHTRAVIIARKWESFFAGD